MTTMLNVGLAAAGAVVGDQSLSESCQDLADTFVDHMEIIGNSMSEVDYEEFVDEHCGGQPLACAPLNIDCGPTSCDPFIPPNPWECLTKIDCGVNQLSANMSSGFSMDNIANAIIFTDISQSAGSWQYENYGHLIGIDPGHNPPGHNDPY